MALFDRSALNSGVARREVAAWALYDFANSGYTTVVLTAVFSAYFVGVVAQQASWATLAWTLTLALSNLAVMLTMPAIGALADRRGSQEAAARDRDARLRRGDQRRCGGVVAAISRWRSC